MKHNNIFQALLIAGLLVGTPLSVDAAGLGKLKVISALGQPLRAEIDLIFCEIFHTKSLSAWFPRPHASKHQKGGPKYPGASLRTLLHQNSAKFRA